MIRKTFAALQHIAPQRTLTSFAGYVSDSEFRPLKAFLIRLFRLIYTVNLEEAVRNDVSQYKSFNDFFTRELQPGARSLEGDDRSCISPADGYISQIGDICQGKLIQAKGVDYSIADLLAHSELADRYSNGRFTTIYLSPSDYHRVHMPLGGKLIKTIYVPGRLFSVSESTTRHLPGLFARNERLICEFETFDGESRFIMVLVGAMIVSGIETVWNHTSPPADEIAENDLQASKITLNRGQEMGRFKLGSTVILLFPDRALQWSSHLCNSQAIRLGAELGKWV